MKVLVVGAGPCGLAAIKELLEAGHEPEAFDPRPYIGGVFGLDPDATYDGLYLTTSNIFMAYSDFPCHDKYIRYSTKEEYAQYLLRYAEHYDLKKHVTLETRVIRATFCADTGKWAVSLSSNDGHSYERSYDAVLCCTGANQKPKMPLTKDLAGYTGKVIHSSDYKNAAAFAGNRVLVVGIGESSADITTEISEVAAQTYAWSRRDVLYAPRFPEQCGYDPNHDEAKVLQGTQAETKVSDLLEYHTTSRFGNYQNLAQYGLLRQLFWRVVGSDKANPQMAEICRSSLACTNGRGWKPFVMADQASWVTKNSRMCPEVTKGTVQYFVAPSILKAEGTSITFSTGQTVANIDVVICCTGYRQDFGWLAEDIGCRGIRSWYKHCVPACFDEKRIAFIGYSRGHQGGIPQMGEMQCRLVANLLAGTINLPKNHAELCKIESKAEEDYYLLSPELKPLVDYPSYMDSMARLIGCEPDVPWLEPSLLFKFFYYPLWPAWYRMRGLGANPSAARAVFDSFPIRTWWEITPVAVIATINYIITKILSTWLFFVPFMPKVGVDRWGFYFWARPKQFVLHGNSMRFKDLFRP